jgi:glucose/arabinose dehydrogenase
VRDLAGAALLAAALAPLPTAALAQSAPQSPTPEAGALDARVTVVAKGLEHPWGIALLPDGGMLVTERAGRLRRVDRNGNVSAPLAGVPQVQAGGQAGLLDLTLSPTFEKDRLVYFSFSEPGDGGAGTAIARGRLAERGLEETTVLWRQQPKVRSTHHWGSRIVFRGDGTMFVTVGDRLSHRDRAQDLTTTIGKIVRLNADGSVPKDNPFVGRDRALPEIWSYGHRNVQAAAIDPQGRELWTVEHGARGGDELNNPQPGRNYGWPVITYGRDYSGLRIGEGTSKAGMEQPVYYWDPVIAPSGATFYTGTAFPGWKGNLLVGSLRPGGLVRLVIEGNRVVKEERYRDGELDARVRDVVQAGDGSIYLVTDEDDGKVLRLSPSQAR